MVLLKRLQVQQALTKKRKPITGLRFGLCCYYAYSSTR